MDRYWRIGGLFKILNLLSQEHPQKGIVGLIVHNTKEFKKAWPKLRELIPKDYYLSYDLLEITLRSGPHYIIFDTYNQGYDFVELVEELLDTNHNAYATLYHNSTFQEDST